MEQQVQRAASLLRVPPLNSTGKPFSTGIDAVFSAWSSLDLHEDVTGLHGVEWVNLGGGGQFQAL
jgi:hypothetical protein